MLRPAGLPTGEEPLTPDELAHHLRLDEVDEAGETYLTVCIKAAREYAEGATGRALVERDWELVLDSFPAGPIEISKVPLDPESIEIRYTDSEGVVQTMASGDFIIVVGEPVRIAPAECWPATKRGRIGAVVVRFSAGPGEEGVPEILRSTMKLHIGDFYEHREETITGTIVNARGVVAAIYDEYLVGKRYA